VTVNKALMKSTALRALSDEHYHQRVYMIRNDPRYSKEAPSDEEKSEQDDHSKEEGHRE
jgi:hypothetical protein